MPGANETMFMARAISLAVRSCGHTRPNPPVGAVVVKGGRIIGEGRHVRCGREHAEFAALGSVRRRGGDPRGATVYVTLEPCSRPGRVGACCDALIAAGVARVVWAVADPNPRNANRAARVLGRAGIATDCWERSRDEERRKLSEEAKVLVAPFAKHVTTGLPYVTVKLAMSLDGRICDDMGDARWVSSAVARRETGRLRERVDAIMVGAETVRRDNPCLLSHGRRNDDLFRVAVTRSGVMPATAKIFTDGACGRTLVFRVAAKGSGGSNGLPDGVKMLEAKNMRDVMRCLGDMGFMHVLCEGGFELARSLAKDGLVDEWIAVIAPKVIGHCRIASAAHIPRVTIAVDGCT